MKKRITAKMKLSAKSRSGKIVTKKPTLKRASKKPSPAKVRVPVHVHPYGADAHHDLDWHLKKFQKLAKKLPEEGQQVVDRAYRLSNERHEGQKRQGGSPYIIHPLRIANILLGEWGMANTPVVAAALLHDVVEDTSTTIKEVKDLFGDEIGKLVDGMTMWKGSETYELYCRRVARGPESLRIIKCADVIDNLRSWHEIESQDEALTKWWKQINDCVLPIADSTYIPAASMLRTLLQDKWYLRKANMQ